MKDMMNLMAEDLKKLNMERGIDLTPNVEFMRMKTPTPPPTPLAAEYEDIEPLEEVKQSNERRRRYIGLTRVMF